MNDAPFLFMSPKVAEDRITSIIHPYIVYVLMLQSDIMLDVSMHVLRLVLMSNLFTVHIWLQNFAPWSKSPIASILCSVSAVFAL